MTCVSVGHTFKVRAGSPAEITFKDRQHLGPDECPECNENRREHLRHQARLCECYDEPCKNGCAYAKELDEIKDPPTGLMFLPEDHQDMPDDRGTIDGFESDAHRDLWELDSTRYGDS